MRDALMQTIETASQSEAFRNYLEVRDRVLQMLSEAGASDESASDYWQEELAGFDYLLDASPLIIQKLREHCYHITGLRSYDYRQHHAHQQEPFAKKLEALQQLDTHHLLVPESPMLGGFGHTIGDQLINIDTLKFYECLIALDRGGLLSAFRNGAPAGDAPRRVALEIGAGWGGFAYQFKTLCPNTCYIIIDLPQTLLFSAVYLKTLFPTASVLFYGDKPNEELLASTQSCDFIFLPHYILPQFQPDRLDLAINMVSFQEMTTEQVESYVRKMHDIGCPNFYSLNRDRSSHNTQLTSVSTILSQYYSLTEVKLLDVAYTSLGAKKKGGTKPPSIVADKAESLDAVKKGLKRSLRETLAGLYHLTQGTPTSSETTPKAGKPGKAEKRPPDLVSRHLFEYRHLIGTRKS